MLKLHLSGIALALILVAVCGPSFAQTSPSDSRQVNAAAQALSAYKSNLPAFQERYPRYQVMPSDILAVSFPLIPELQTVSVTVQPDGFITLPNGGGTIYVKGDTIPQIVDILTKAYSTTMHNPIVSVDVTNFQPPLFTVNGQVGKPGQYPLRIDTTVSEGIAVAGGFLATAKTQVFLFHRVSTDWMEVKKINIKQLLNGHNIHEDVHLQAGDMIFVPDKFIANFRKYVPYNLGSAVGWNGNAFVAQ
ncbi:MAG: polysaccharide biosynthesis/export family protein [Terriglobales bacterium]